MVEHVLLPIGAEVEFVACAQENIVGGVESFLLIRAQEPVVLRTILGQSVTGDEARPLQIVDIPQAAGAFLNVRF
jgi:hypothetical protein